MKDVKQLKMELLEKLMEEMDSSISKRLIPKDSKVEQEELPLEDTKEMIDEKPSSVLKLEDEEEDEELGDSSLMQRLNELRKKKQSIQE